MGEGMKGLESHDYGDVWLGFAAGNWAWGAWEVEVIGLKKVISGLIGQKVVKRRGKRGCFMLVVGRIGLFFLVWGKDWELLAE